MPSTLIEEPQITTELLFDVKFANPTGLKLDADFESQLPQWKKDAEDWLLDDDLSYHSESRSMDALLEREDAVESGSQIFWGKVIVKQKRWINSSGREYRRATTIQPTEESLTRPSRYRMGPFYENYIT